MHRRLLVAIAALPRPAAATEYTDMPEKLSGTVGLNYVGFAEWGALEEAGEEISKRQVSRHDLDYVVQFAPTRGFAAVIDISHTPSVRYAYPNARKMLTEPVNGGGTYLLGGSNVDTLPEVRGSGLNGVWLGAALAPYAERYDRHQPASWRLDAAFRTGNKSSNLWTAPDGKRGAAPGGTAYRFSGAFSARMGRGNPWMRAEFVKENRVEGVEIVDEDGVSYGVIDLAPASNFELRTGVEAIGTDDPETGNRFAADFFFGFGYRTWEDVASGVYLPDPINAGRRVPVTAGDLVYLLGGLAFDLHVSDVVIARTGPEVRFHTPYRPEHLYDVRTAPEHFGFGWVFRLQAAIDPTGDPEPAP